MRKVIRKQIRRSKDGVNLAADVNIVIATGEGQKSHTVASSRQTVEQRSDRPEDANRRPEKGPDKGD